MQTTVSNIAMHPAPTPAGFQNWYDEAVDARQANNISTARAVVERILEQDTKHAAALYMHGLLALASKQFEAAQGWIDRAIEVNPHPDLYATPCGVQLELNAHANALETVRQGYAIQPDALKPKFYEAGALLMQELMEEAARSYCKLTALGPDIIHRPTKQLFTPCRALQAQHPTTSKRCMSRQ